MDRGSLHVCRNYENDHYENDLLQNPTLAAAMCDPALVYRESGIFECTGGLAAFRTLLDLRCRDDSEQKADIMSALMSMRRQRGVCVLYGCASTLGVDDLEDLNEVVDGEDREYVDVDELPDGGEAGVGDVGSAEEVESVYSDDDSGCSD
jgi:hypothetical protein